MCDSLVVVTQFPISNVRAHTTIHGQYGIYSSVDNKIYIYYANGCEFEEKQDTIFYYVENRLVKTFNTFYMTKIYLFYKLFIS